MLNFEMDDANLKESLENISRAAGDVSTPLLNAGMAILQENLITFLGEKSPGGVPWTPLRGDTLKTKKGPGILRETGALFRSVTSQGAPGNIFRHKDNSLDLGTTIPYGAVHQLGLGAVPARPFLGINQEMAQEVLTIFQEWLEMN